MKASLIRSLIALVMILSLALLISSPALAEVKPLPLDQTVPGIPAQEDCWIDAANYQNDSITEICISSRRGNRNLHNHGSHADQCCKNSGDGYLHDFFVHLFQPPFSECFIHHFVRYSRYAWYCKEA